MQTIKKLIEFLSILSSTKLFRIITYLVVSYFLGKVFIHLFISETYLLEIEPSNFIFWLANLFIFTFIGLGFFSLFFLIAVAILYTYEDVKSKYRAKKI